MTAGAVYAPEPLVANPSATGAAAARKAPSAKATEAKAPKQRRIDERNLQLLLARNFLKCPHTASQP
jgi:hypothetical protein